MAKISARMWQSKKNTQTKQKKSTPKHEKPDNRLTNNPKTKQKKAIINAAIIKAKLLHHPVLPNARTILLVRLVNQKHPLDARRILNKEKRRENC
jgi:hypothetical protein